MSSTKFHLGAQDCRIHAEDTSCCVGDTKRRKSIFGVLSPYICDGGWSTLGERLGEVWPDTVDSIGARNHSEEKE